MHEWFLYLVVGILGALIGSFLNVCIFRLPRGESIAWPGGGSHCRSFATPSEALGAAQHIFQGPHEGDLVTMNRCHRLALPRVQHGVNVGSAIS